MARRPAKHDGPFLAFTGSWFARWQWLLLLILNEPLLGRWFRWVLCIRPEDIGHRAQIVALYPHAYVIARQEPGARHLVEYAGFRPRWVRSAPRTVYTADIRTHAKYAKRIYYAFRPLWWALHAWDWAVADRWVPALSAGFSTLTVYPDPGSPGTTSIDGSLHINIFGDTWAAIRASNATDISDTGTQAPVAGFVGSPTANQWAELWRSIFCFDTSVLTGSASVSAAVLSVYGSAKQDDLAATPDIDVVTSSPAATTTLVAADIKSMGQTSQTGAAMAYGSWSTSGYNAFTLNGTGIANVSTTAISTFGLRNMNYDAANSAPPYAASTRSSFTGFFADETGSTNDPKLVITYTLSSPSASVSPSTSLSPSSSRSPSVSTSASVSPSSSRSPSISASASVSPSASRSPSASASASISPSSSRSPSASVSPSRSASASVSPSASLSPSASPSVSPSSSRSPSVSTSSSTSPSRSPSSSRSPSASLSPSASASPSRSPSSSRSPSASLSPSSSVSPSVAGPDGLALLAQFTPGVWTEITGETLATSQFTFRRGMTGGGPHDRVAPTGTCVFTLKNGPTGDNTSRPNGYYSFASTSCRAGWTFGTPIRVVYTLSGADYFLWTGKLKSAKPTPGRFATRQVDCLAVDCINDLAETDVRAIVPQVNQTENALIAAIIAALPSAAQPTGVTYDASLDTYPYALDNASNGAKALQLLSDVIVSMQGYAYPLGNGLLKIENRQARPMRSSAYAFGDADLDECDVPADTSGLYNLVRVTTHPRRVDPTAATVLFGLTTAQLVHAGETITIWGDYSDPSNTQQLIGGTAQVTPLVSGTDYAANSSASGGGSDQTGHMSITVEAFAASVKFTVTNTGVVDAYLVDAAGVPLLQIRGKGVYDDAPVTYEASSVQSYGEHLLEIDLPYQADGSIAQYGADILESQYSALDDKVTAIGFAATPTPALLTQAITREIGDIVTVTETMTGLSAVEAVINGIEWTVLPAQWVRCRYILAPRLLGFPASVFSATGGTQTIDGLYTVHTFDTVGTQSFSVLGGRPTDVEVLVVAAGGGGAGADGVQRAGGGAGGGGVRTAALTLAPGAYTVTVGDGGLPGVGNANGSDGGASAFDAIATVGGGGGAATGQNGRSGGSGSGGGGNNAGPTTTGGSGTAGQGTAGAAGSTSGDADAGGGGGGAATPGGAAGAGIGGPGGEGLASSLTGASETYGSGGGGGGVFSAGSGGTNAGAGGVNANGTAVVENRGAGGGGASSTDGFPRAGSKGSKGRVVVRYLTP